MRGRDPAGLHANARSAARLLVDEDEGESREGALGGALSGFVMTEIDLLKRSSFRWVDLFGTEDALMATGFTAWGGIFWLEGLWYAVGGAQGCSPSFWASVSARLPGAGR